MWSEHRRRLRGSNRAGFRRRGRAGALASGGKRSAIPSPRQARKLIRTSPARGGRHDEELWLAPPLLVRPAATLSHDGEWLIGVVNDGWRLVVFVPLRAAAKVISSETRLTSPGRLRRVWPDVAVWRADQDSNLGVESFTNPRVTLRHRPSSPYIELLLVGLVRIRTAV
jgi:hypothetical protein